jgi:hypothetical protein
LVKKSTICSSNLQNFSSTSPSLIAKCLVLL